MSILSNAYESELDIHVFIENAERVHNFHKQCEFIFDNKWSAEAMLIQHLSDELAVQVNERIIKQIHQEIFTQMSVPVSLFK